MKTNSTTAAESAVTKTTIKDLKPGDFFKLSPTSKTVYIRGTYDRSLRKYECQKYDDVNACQYLRGDRTAYTDFTF